MIILVCGGRKFGDLVGLNGNQNDPMWAQRLAEYRFIFRTLDFAAIEFSKYYNPNDNWLPFDITIMSGMATGADTVAVDWAVMNCCPVDENYADWARYGDAAGPIRNQIMTDKKPDLVIAFPGAKSKGTRDMIRRAKKAGIEVRVMTHTKAVAMKGDTL
jgi:hypothetical protein